MPALPAEAAHLGDGHARQPDADEGLLHVIQLVMTNDRFNLLHGTHSKVQYRGSVPTAIQASNAPPDWSLKRPVRTLA
jgi:hypothetical protein